MLGVSKIVNSIKYHQIFDTPRLFLFILFVQAKKRAPSIRRRPNCVQESSGGGYSL